MKSRIHKTEVPANKKEKEATIIPAGSRAAPNTIATDYLACSLLEYFSMANRAEAGMAMTPITTGAILDRISRVIGRRPNESTGHRVLRNMQKNSPYFYKIAWVQREIPGGERNYAFQPLPMMALILYDRHGFPLLPKQWKEINELEAYQLRGKIAAARRGLAAEQVKPTGHFANKLPKKQKRGLTD